MFDLCYIEWSSHIFVRELSGHLNVHWRLFIDSKGIFDTLFIVAVIFENNHQCIFAGFSL